MLEFKKKAAADVELPNAGNIVLFLDVLDNFYKTKNDAGVVTVLGRGISNIARTSGTGAAGTVDTYTITVDGGATYTFMVTNGANGADGAAVATRNEGALLTSNTTEYNFVGAGVEATNTGGAVTVTINGGNAFSSVTGNTGTASADAPGDSLAITGSNGLSTTATDTPDGLVISPSYGAPTGLAPDGTNDAGVANTFARSDHVHATPAATAVGLAGNSNSAEGTSSAFARADHTHAISNGGTPSSLGGANNEGTSTSLARSDHVHLNPVIAHEAAGDPHPQYTTTAEASAAAPVQSVNGQTGVVTLALGTNNAAVTSTAASASFSTTLTTVRSFAITGGSIVPGSSYYLYASGRVINTTTTSNLVITVSVGATNVLVLTQALGATARAAPGGAFSIEGMVTFYSATQAECDIRAFTSAAVAFDVGLNTSAPITVSTATNTTLDLKVNTSAASSTIIIRQASIFRMA